MASCLAQGPIWYFIVRCTSPVGPIRGIRTPQTDGSRPPAGRFWGNVTRAMRRVSAGCWRPWALRDLQPYLRIWEGFLEEVTFKQRPKG